MKHEKNTTRYLHGTVPYGTERNMLCMQYHSLDGHTNNNILQKIIQVLLRYYLSLENMMNSLSRGGHIFRIHTNNRWICRNGRFLNYSSGPQGPNNGVSLVNKYFFHSGTFLITTALSSVTVTLCDDDKDNDFFSKIKASLDKNEDFMKSLDGVARDVGSKVSTFIVD